MNASIQLGTGARGEPVMIDVAELLATRLLVQGNSGSGKSHLLRRLLEESAGMVQQVVIDPEGDFVTLAERFGHSVIDGGAYSGAELARLAALVREHRASVVLALDSLEVEAQMRCAALFLSALFDAPREHWYPALVIVDEAQMFAPALGGDSSDEARKLSLGAMTNLMCRGRKRGLAGVVATQRLAKLAKNVAAEASNFLMGRTFLDIDMARAADLLGMERRSAEEIRDLERGHFLGLGPAISRRPVAVRIGPVQTRSQAVSHAMAPPPPVSGEALNALLAAAGPLDSPPPPPPAPRPEELIAAPPPAPRPSAAVDPGAAEAILASLAAEDGATFRPAASLFQDFLSRCRRQGIPTGAWDPARFRRSFAFAAAGIAEQDPQAAELVRAAQAVPDDLLAPFLLIARAAEAGDPFPDDEAIGRVYGTSSPGRVRRLLDHLEKSGLIVVRTDFSGRRAVSLPQLGLATAPLEA